MNFHQPTETGKPVYDPLVDTFELLMKLYPDEHPANLHGVMCVTNNNIVETMKILQYYRSYREMSKQQLERSTSTYLPPSMMSTYVPQASTIPSMPAYKTHYSMPANEVQFPSPMNTDQHSASMYAYKTQPTQFTNTSQQPCMYPYKTLPSISAHEAQTPTSNSNAGQLPVSLYEPERFMYKYEPELSRSLYQTSIPTSQHMYSLFDQPYSMSSEEKQLYNTTCTPKSSVFPHDLYHFTPLCEPQVCCTSLSEPQSSLPVYDPQHSTVSSEVQHSSSVSDASESQPTITTFDTSSTSPDMITTSTDMITTSTDMITTSTDLNTTSTDLNTTSTDLNTTSTDLNSTSTDLSSTSTAEFGSLAQDYAVSNSSSDDDNRDYIVLVPVEDQEMELTPSGVVPPAYRMTSAYRGRNGQFIKNLD